MPLHTPALLHDPLPLYSRELCVIMFIVLLLSYVIFGEMHELASQNETAVGMHRRLVSCGIFHRHCRMVAVTRAQGCVPTPEDLPNPFGKRAG